MEHSARRPIRAAAAALFGALGFIGVALRPAAAQCPGLWAQADLGPQTGHIMAYDSARQRVLLQCVSPADGAAAGTWAWNGATWTRAAFDGPWPARSEFALAYDRARDRLVLFGGIDRAGNPLGDTWEFDGTHWRLMSTQGPSARFSASMAYHAGRSTVMLFGGGTPKNSTELWEWDGWDWRLVNAAGPPPTGFPLPMVYDSFRARLILLSSGTWEFNGTGWDLLTPDEPPWQAARSICYDTARRRVVLFGGPPGCSPLDPGQTWEFNETAWVKRTPPASPTWRSLQSMAYDERAQAAVLFGGRKPAQTNCGPAINFDDTWTWDGNTWTRAPRSRPDPRNYTTQVFDSARGRSVLFGGLVNQCGFVGCVSYLDDTWLWNTVTWTEVTPATRPAPRNLHASVFDTLRARMLMFGGSSLINQYADTWAFDGAWTQVATTGPGIRTEHAMGYDPDRDRVLLFGGTSNGPPPTTTWEWNGSAWENVTPDGVSPPPRSAGALAFDPVRRTMILFGGASLITGTQLADTWEWNGKSWTLLPVAGPPARQGHAMSTDPLRNVIMMTGGGGGAANRDDTWEWDGASWTQVGAGGPSNAGQTMVYDTVHATTFMRSFNASWDWHGPVAPTIVQQPASVVSNVGRRAVFECVPEGPGAVFIEWFKDGIIVQDDKRIRGATTSRLVIRDLVPGDAAHYDARVSNACGHADSDTVTLTVYCTADYNRDGSVNQVDHDSFLADWLPGDPSADVNDDGFIDGIDYDRFHNAYEAGC